MIYIPSSDPDRCTALNILAGSNIPFVVWHYDAEGYFQRGELQRFGRLDLLVHDPDEAASVLQRCAWRALGEIDVPASEDRNPGKYLERRFIPTLATKENMLETYKAMGQPTPSAEEMEELLEGEEEEPDEDSPMTTILTLMRDSDWGFDVQQHWATIPGDEKMYPSLAVFVDALITRYYKAEEHVSEPLRGQAFDQARSTLHELYYHDHKHDILAALLEPDFTAKLSPINRLWHLDAVAGRALGYDYLQSNLDKRQQWLEEHKSSNGRA